jgi:hypothetical protein
MTITQTGAELTKKAGRIKFSIEDPKLREPYFGLTKFEFGESENGPLMVILVIPPDIEFAPHYHNTDYCTVVMKGALKVGNTWYNEGDIRVQDEGSVYGPIWSGPDGCTTLNFYGDRAALPDQFTKEAHKQRFEELMPIARAAYVEAGIGANAAQPDNSDIIETSV